MSACLFIFVSSRLTYIIYIYIDTVMFVFVSSLLFYYHSTLISTIIWWWSNSNSIGISCIVATALEKACQRDSVFIPFMAIHWYRVRGDDVIPLSADSFHTDVSPCESAFSNTIFEGATRLHSADGWDSTHFGAVRHLLLARPFREEVRIVVIIWYFILSLLVALR